MKKHFFSILFVLIACHGSAQQLSVTNLQCGHRINPLGIDETKPFLSWQLASSNKNVLQTAYRILVSDDSVLLQKNTGNIWDSKKIISSASVQVKYAGSELRSAKTYYWKIIAWDNKGNTSGSATSFWQMGLFDQSAWNNAKWIAYDILPDSNKIVPAAHGSGKKAWGKRKDILPLFRKPFVIGKEIKNATLFISGLGHFEAFINGKKVGDHFLDPGWTKYDKQAMYVTFNVTDMLHRENNAIGVMLGNGFYYVPGERYRKLTGGYGYPKMICRLLINYTDGTSQDIVSDESWKTAPSPITFSSIYGGEDYDANLEQKNWDSPVFKDDGWKNALITDGPLLVSQKQEPLKIMQSFSPVKTTRISDSVYVYDVAQNMSGIPEISLRGKKGDTVKITTAELINADGTANQKATGSPSYYLYVLKGESVETWRPRFTYYGFRYIQVYGAVAATDPNSLHLPVVVSVKGLHTRNAAERVGSFTSSNDLFNKTSELIDWSVKSNMASVFTDCPHREKLGWLEETHLVGSSVKFDYDIATLCRKAITDMQVSQAANGLIPEIAPEFVQFDEPFRDSPEWGSAAIILPWYVYQWYGDKDVLVDSYAMMQRYISYLQSKDSSCILMQGLGDWYDLGPDHPGVSQLTPKGLTATATYYYDLTLLTNIAKLLNKTEDVKKYSLLSADVKKAFNKAFFNPATKQYGSGSQTSNAMAVYMKLVDEKDKAAVIENIVKDIRGRNNALTSGDIGYRYLLKVLDEAGRSDVIFDMNNRSDVPGYGYQLAKGATALTESWQALPGVSNNHFMLGHILEWFYEGLAGISQSEDGAGFQKIIIRPQVVGDVTHAKAGFQSPYGLIVSDWTKKNDQFELNVTIPVNTTATIYLPAGKGSTVILDGKKIDPVKWENGKVLIKTGSGNYHFVVK
ncbi:MAG: family 78 glycoside hydrolase catalytic domain [Bacteroidota bacterium]